MTRNVRKRLLVSVGIALVVSAALSAAFLLNLFTTAQIRSTDFLFQSRAGDQARAAVIVGIDQRSYRALIPQYGAMAFWPRTLYARALLNLRQAGARAIVFDIFFDAPKPEDSQVAAAIAQAGNVLMPVEAQGPGSVQTTPGIAQEFDVFFRSTAGIQRAAAAEGLVNVATDQDTVVRSVPLLLRAGGETLPALALVAVSRFIRWPTVIDEPPTAGTVHGAGRAIPVVENGNMLINFLGPPSSPDRGGPFRILSFVDVLNGSFDRSLVRDKIVLVGLTIRGVDELSTPTTASTRMWGVEVLGNAIETILSQQYLRPVPPAVTVWLIVGLALGATLLGWARRPLLATSGMAGLCGLYLAIAAIRFDDGTVLNLVFPPAAIVLAFTATLVYRVVFEQAEQRLIRDAMARYLSPSVSQWVLREPERLNLGGETRAMTVLFSDLRDFTTISHTLDPQALVRLINEYMSAMTAVIFRHDGVLDKYIGDGIMAFWNAPLDQPDHARRACETALDMNDTIRGLQADWQRRGIPKIEMRIGINTGLMVVGNMGSRERLAYTVMGDAVNVASRLEGLGKEYGTHVVIGDATRAAAGDAFVYRFLDVVAVKGRAEPLAVHEVVGQTAGLEPASIRLLDRYRHGIELYRTRRWAEAGGVFHDILATAPDDGPSRLYQRRCREFIAHPPPAEWDGVYVAQVK